VRTYTPKAADVTRAWHVIDATDVILGRLASQAAILLRGKHKAYYAPHVDTGDFVVVINAGKVAMTGNKRADTEYIRHSGFPGGLSRRSYEHMLSTRPEVIVEKAIKGMLPHTSLGRQMAGKLKVYAGPEHPHQAQSPVPFALTQVSQIIGTTPTRTHAG
jgi:large subunit ribosomal protein L13